MSEELSDGGEMAAIAENLGVGELYKQVEAEVSGEEYVAPEETDDQQSGDDEQGDVDQMSDENVDGADESEDNDDDGGDDKSEKKIWDITPDRPEVLDSDEFQSFLEQSGKTEEEFVAAVLNGVMHKTKIRGKEIDVPYSKLIADAQMAGASRKKSQRMNGMIADGRMLAQVREGGEGGLLALKQILKDAGASYESEDIMEIIDNSLELDGEYDKDKLLSEAKKISEVENYFGDVLDSPEYQDNINKIKDDMDNWLPSDMANDMRENPQHARYYYDVVSSPDYPAIKGLMNERLAALPHNVKDSILSNTENFQDMFEDTVSMYAKSFESNQPEGQPITKQARQPRKISNSESVSPPRRSSGKRTSRSRSDANKNPLEMTSAELRAHAASQYGVT